MIGVAVALIVLAVLLGALGLFSEGIGILFWIGVVLLVVGVIAYIANGRNTRL